MVSSISYFWFFGCVRQSALRVPCKHWCTSPGAPARPWGRQGRQPVRPSEFVELAVRLSDLVRNLEQLVAQRTEKLERQTVLLKGEIVQKKAQESLQVSNDDLENALNDCEQPKMPC